MQIMPWKSNNAGEKGMKNWISCAWGNNKVQIMATKKGSAYLIVKTIMTHRNSGAKVAKHATSNVWMSYKSAKDEN
jgi:hypothetical protein